MGTPDYYKYLGELREKVVPHGQGSVTPYYVESAKGAVIYDVDGREFIDFAGGIGVMNVGHSHPKVVAAIKGGKTQWSRHGQHLSGEKRQ